MLLFTLKRIVQLPLAGMEIPEKLRAVAPAVRVAGLTPEQVPVTAPPAADMFVRVSVKAPPVIINAFEFASVRVTTEVPVPD
jgi:hypothetical protein